MEFQNCYDSEQCQDVKLGFLRSRCCIATIRKNTEVNAITNYRNISNKAVLACNPFGVCLKEGNLRSISSLAIRCGSSTELTENNCFSYSLQFISQFPYHLAERCHLIVSNFIECFLNRTASFPQFSSNNAPVAKICCH